MLKFFIFFLSLFMFFSISWAEEDLPCEGDNYDSAKERSNAYYFGVEIQEIVKNRDLKALFNLVDGELREGPAKILIEGKEFSDVFSEEWRTDILTSVPECYSYRESFPLTKEDSDGGIYYRYYESSYQGKTIKEILYIVGASVGQKIDSSNEPIGWRPITENGKGEVLPPDCFVHRGVSADHYETYYTSFTPLIDPDRKSVRHFILNPGLYFEKELSVQDAMTAPKNSWLKPLIKSVEDCRMERAEKNSPDITIEKDGSIHIGNIDEDGSYSTTLDHEYKILATIPISLCHELAPHIKHPCRQAYLIDYFEETGGTTNLYFYNIYGEFDLLDGRKIIVPLKNHWYETEAAAFLIKGNIPNVKIRTQ